MLDGYKSNKFDIGVATGRGQQAVMNLGQVLWSIFPTLF
jgi:hypothetical protein